MYSQREPLRTDSMRWQPSRSGWTTGRAPRHSPPIAATTSPNRGLSLRDSFWPLTLLLPLALSRCCAARRRSTSAGRTTRRTSGSCSPTALVCARARARDQRGRSPPPRRAAAADRARVRRQRRVPRPPRARDAGRVPRRQERRLRARDARRARRSPACFAAASAVEYRLETSLWIVRRARLLLGLVLALIAAWAAVSLAELPPLRDAVDAGGA